MLSFLVGLSIVSLYIAIFGNLILLPLLRFVIVLVNKTPQKQALKIVFLPLSMGYYLDVQKKNTLHYIYMTIHVLLFVFALLGTIFLFYTRFA